MDYHRPIKASDKTTYSLDMVRLRCDFGKRAQDFCDYLSHIASCDLRYDVQYAYSFNHFKYRHLWTVKDTLDGSSWTVGQGIADTPTCGFIEFNPNKCEKSDLFKGFWQTFADRTFNRELVRFDLAIDIPRPRSEVFLLRHTTTTYTLVVSDDGVTEYTGRRSHSGFVKVYDKTKEAHLSEDLTRVELTLDKNADPDKLFPDVRMRDNQLSLMTDASELRKPMRLLAKLIAQSDNPQTYLSELDSRQRKKIEPYLANTALSLDLKAFHLIRQQALSYENHTP